MLVVVVVFVGDDADEEDIVSNRMGEHSATVNTSLGYEHKFCHERVLLMENQRIQYYGKGPSAA